MPTDDHDGERSQLSYFSADPHGRAAFLLIESLLHVLQERGILSLDDVVDILDTAVTVQTDVIDADDGRAKDAAMARALLTEIALSLGVPVLGTPDGS